MAIKEGPTSFYCLQFGCGSKQKNNFSRISEREYFQFHCECFEAAACVLSVSMAGGAGTNDLSQNTEKNGSGR